MLTAYDEYPVHQSPHPFSHIPSTDYSWDDGHYFGVFSAKHKIFLVAGMRVNPNTDMIGGYAIINISGTQTNVRFSRCWRRLFDTAIGPLRFEFIEPLKIIRLVLEDNDSDLSFDLEWKGVIPAYQEEHHIAINRGRRTTDQTRYSQIGVVNGVIKYKGKTIPVHETEWTGDRDHSWGIYADRPPLGAKGQWLPPPEAANWKRRAFRFWMPFRCGEYSGFYHFHESETGEQCKLNDVFGSPFEGVIYRGWEVESVKLKRGLHQLEFVDDTRILKAGTVVLVDENDEEWVHRVNIPVLPWIVQPMGYLPGSWKDGGTMHTYHGSEELAIEWDEIDATVQPFSYTPYSSETGMAETNASIEAVFGLGGGTDKIHGVEYLAELELTAPDGSVHNGQGHIECFINGRFDPYGFS